MKNVYVGRHPAALEWAKAHGLPEDAKLVVGNATPADVEGRVVWGVVPLHLAAAAAEVHVIEFAGTPPRGLEYGRAEMDAAGARWARYRVQRVE